MDSNEAIQMALSSWYDENALDFDLALYDYATACADPEVILPARNDQLPEDANDTIQPWQLNTGYDRVENQHGDGGPSSRSSDVSTFSPSVSEASTSRMHAAPTATAFMQQPPAHLEIGTLHRSPQTSATINRQGSLGRRIRITKETDNPQMVPHTVIERRYRVKLGNHFQALQRSIPTLRDPQTPAPVADEQLANNSLTKGLRSTHKRNKATVCLKAVEYIQHLEAQVRAYERLNKHDIDNA